MITLLENLRGGGRGEGRGKENGWLCLFLLLSGEPQEGTESFPLFPSTF